MNRTPYRAGTIARVRSSASGILKKILGSSAVVILVAATTANAATMDDFARVRRFADAGATEAALATVETLQPKEPQTPGWPAWERLRCELLARLGRHADLLARASAISVDSDTALTTCLLEGARSALVQNDPGGSRALAARLLWQRNPTAAQAQAARLAVIESYVAERRGEDAFRSMLRYQQDYQPLERAVGERFAQALLDLGQDRDALNWLDRSNEITPTRLRLQLRGGALSAEATIKAARAALARKFDPGYWRVIDEAAQRNGNASLHIEALERLLQGEEANDRSGRAAERLWQAYRQTAGDLGNRERLLVGDDSAWADYAARRLGSDPFAARAFYAFLTERAQNPEIKRNAQLQLAYALSSSGLDFAALRLIGQPGMQRDTFDAQTRNVLGTIAAKRNQGRVALELWQGLPAPPGVSNGEWQLTLARMQLRAGNDDASVNTIRRAFSGSIIPPEVVQPGLDLAQEMTDLGKLDSAAAVYSMLVSAANEKQSRAAYFGLARAQELKGDATAAAGSYLAAAFSSTPSVADPMALQARLLAGLNLMRAGFKEDARAQFEWLMKNSKDTALLEAARRGLNRL
jgi:hypothetical protein